MKRREKNLLLGEKEPDNIETWVCKRNDQLRTDIKVVTKKRPLRTKLMTMIQFWVSVV